MSDPSGNRTPKANAPSAGRGIALVAFATIIGIFLLWKGPSKDSQVQADASQQTESASATTKQTVATTSTAPVPVTAIAPAALTITVANGSGKAKVAGTLAERLKGQGYTSVKPTNAVDAKGGVIEVPATVIYFDAGYEADAKAVATAAGLNVAAVAARPATGVPLSAADAAANVLVILGVDYVPSAAPAASGAVGASAATG